jgi:hypothetical protein
MTEGNHVYPVRDSNNRLQALPTTDALMRRVLSRQAEVA